MSLWRRTIIGGALAVLAAGVPVALAQPNAALVRHYVAGDFVLAANAAEASGTADDLAFAARSLLALCMTGPARINADVLDRAYQDAAKAVALDRTHIEGRLQLAIAASLQTRSMGLMEANRSGLGKLGKLLVEGVLEDEPENFYAHGFTAVWNLEVRRRAGALGAVMVGASIDEARRHYREAVRLAPEDIGVRWQYGRALAALDADKYREDIETALEAALAAPADDHVEAVMQERSRMLLEAMQVDRDKAGRLALELL